MTREEEIIQEANTRYNVSHPFIDIAKDSFIEGAKWADKTMFDKFCKWIESTDIDMEYWNSEDGVCKELLIEGCKKAMEL